MLKMAYSRDLREGDLQERADGGGKSARSAIAVASDAGQGLMRIN